MRTAKEIWGVLDKETGDVLYTRGGSSTKSRIMVYKSKAMAQKVLKSPWIKQMIKDENSVEVRLIYIADYNNDEV